MNKVRMQSIIGRVITSRTRHLCLPFRAVTIRRMYAIKTDNFTNLLNLLRPPATLADFHIITPKMVSLIGDFESKHRRNYRVATYEEVRDVPKKGHVWLIDVRDCQEIENTCGIPGALNIPRNMPGQLAYEAIKNREADQLLIDVRDPNEVALTGLIPGSINIPFVHVEGILKEMAEDQFLKRFKLKKPGKNDTIIFSCKSGGRALKAAQLVEALGYTKIFYYPGSWADYEKRSKEEKSSKAKKK